MLDIAASIITAARLQAGLSQRELARLAGTSQPAIAKLERGESSPTVSTLQRVAAAAGFELRFELAPRTARDAVVDAYKRDVDRSLLRENLKKSVDDRVAALIDLQALAIELERAGRTAGRRRKRG